MAIAVLAIGARSMTISHINENYFWDMSKFFGTTTTKTTLKSHSATTHIQGIVAILLLSLIQYVTTYI